MADLNDLNIVVDLVSHIDDLSKSNTIKTLKEFPKMMGEIDDIINELGEEIPLDLIVSYVSILTKACQDLKPIYLKMLLVKEAHNANK